MPRFTCLTLDTAAGASRALLGDLVSRHGRVGDEQAGALREFGHSDRAIADMAGVVALNVLTGAFDLLTGLTPGSDADA